MTSKTTRFRNGSRLLASTGLVLITVMVPPLGAQNQTGQTDNKVTFPTRGSLVIVGGAMEDPEIFGRFLDLAGGPDAPIIVVPTASGEPAYGEFWYGLIRLRKMGANNITLLHTKDRDEANSEVFVAPIKEAGGVWFEGGRQWRLADSYLDTRFEEELWALLDRGGVIGGSSAGATIQGSYLARGDTKTNTVMMGDHEEGFGFLGNVAIDQHLLRRNRHFDLLEIIQAKPHLLGIGIDENTAIVVQRGRFEVMGRGYVVIYDATHQIDSGGDFYFMAPGDRFDLSTRRPSRGERSWETLERVTERSSGNR